MLRGAFALSKAIRPILVGPQARPARLPLFQPKVPFSSAATHKSTQTDGLGWVTESYETKVDNKGTGKKIADFNVHPEILSSLNSKGINEFFPIQELSFDKVSAGQDLVVRGRTGTGKTYAFAIPIANKLRNKKETLPRLSKVQPSVLILEPTRELANQVKEVFSSLSPAISVTPVFGGASYVPQEISIRKGTDVIVGTPGRIMDLLERGTLSFSNIDTVVLDEADNMLDRGFDQDIERILSYVPTTRQMLLFSATVPDWIQQVAKKYLKKPTVIDLIGKQANQTSTTVKHLAIHTPTGTKTSILIDILTVYAKGRVIIFTETKSMADQLGDSQFVREEARVIHGDVSQFQREQTLADFRNGVFRILVATNVAARGLDIPEVDTVIQFQPPNDLENYIHRSGRCGRAGRSGQSIILYEANQAAQVSHIESQAGIKFERPGLPHPQEIVRECVEMALDKIKTVKPAVTNQFLDRAKEIARTLQEQPGQDGTPVERFIASALSVISGHQHQAFNRSLFGSIDYTTLLFKFRQQPKDLSGNPRPLTKPMVERELSKIDVELVSILGKAFPTEDGTGMVIDARQEFVDQIKQGLQGSAALEVIEITQLPALKMMTSSSFGRGSSGRDDRGGNRFGSGGSRGGYSPQNRYSGGSNKFGDRSRGDNKFGDRSRGDRNGFNDRYGGARGNYNGGGRDRNQGQRGGGFKGSKPSWEVL